MSHLADARSALHAALVPILPVGRVSLYPPEQIVSPCIFIESSVGSLTTIGNSTMIRATFAVVGVVDGAQKPQVLDLDELTARIWDASRLPPATNPTSWQPGSIDVGGVTQRSVSVSVETIITARTLCNPPLQ